MLTALQNVLTSLFFKLNSNSWRWLLSHSLILHIIFLTNFLKNLYFYTATWIPYFETVSGKPRFFCSLPPYILHQTNNFFVAFPERHDSCSAADAIACLYLPSLVLYSIDFQTSFKNEIYFLIFSTGFLNIICIL